MKALDLAKYIVDKCTRENQPISNLQLQKILFYIQRECLRTYDQPIFLAEIEAWKFGPVVRVVYFHFCGSGGNRIRFKFHNIHELKVDFKEIVDEIVEEKRQQEPWALVNDTHCPQGAWCQIFDSGAGEHDVIPIELIKELG